MADKLTALQLAAIVDSEIQSAMSTLGGELSNERSEAMDRYLGEPLGTEMEGRSQVHSRDVMDVIEWVLPSLIRIFVDADSAVSIEPVGPEDEPQADQETDYLNYLFFKQNNGFLILYSWFKDALLQKNGVVKSWVEEYEHSTRETYHNLTEIGLATLLADDGLEVIEHETESLINADSGAIQAFHHVTVLRKDTKKRFQIEVVPPEEFLISKDASSVDPKNARFTAHRTVKTVSEMKEMGYSAADIKLMEFGLSGKTLSEESIARMHLSDEQQWSESFIVNEAMQQVTVTECYLYADRNGDGVAELLKVLRSGKFIDVEEVDRNPFAALTPIILTHKFYGLSVADIIKDIQEIRTALLRSYLDNFYQAINGTTYYDENRVNIDDMLTSKPYGNRAVDGTPTDAVLHIPPQGLPPQAYTLFEVLDRMRNERIGDFQSQLDPNVLRQANVGVVVQMMAEARAKVEMIARIFAETGVRQLFRDLHELARKHADPETRFKLRNTWVPVNPQEWHERTNLTVKVGLGTHNKQERLAHISGILDIQQRLVQGGGLGTLITPNNIYQALREYTEAAGFNNPDKFFLNPAMAQPQQPKPDPQLLLIQAQQQIEQMRTDAKREQVYIEEGRAQREEALRVRELEIQEQSNMAKQQVEQIKQQIAGLRATTESQDREAKIEVSAQSLRLEADLKQLQLILQQREANQQMQLDKYKAELAAQIDLSIAQMREGAKESKAETNSDKLLVLLLDRIEQMQTDMSTPKEITRDKDGRIVSIGNKKVIRDEIGRPSSIE